jgi:glycosyltransferase involved in cell wall biosynthesis
MSPRPLMRAMEAHTKACAEEIRSRGFDVHLIATCQFLGASPIARYLEGPTVLYLQEPHRWLYESNPELPWLAAPAPTGIRRRLAQPARVVTQAVRIHRCSQRARFEVESARAFDLVLVNSLFSRETIRRVYGLDASVCYLGVDTERFRATGAARARMVLGVGHLSTHKNARLLVEAVGRIGHARPRVEWVAAGTDPLYVAEVRAHAKRHGVDFVTHEAATDELLVSLLNRARALVYLPRLEPFGLVPLEANACGLPVVAIAEGGVRETISHDVNGLLVGPDPGEVARAIERVLDDDRLLERLGKEGRRIVEERWTTAAASERLEAALNDVLR